MVESDSLGEGGLFMSLIDEERANELVGEVRVAHEAVRDAVEREVSKGRSRLRASAKTRKSAATRGRIMESVRALMRERRAIDFQMSEVAERAGITKGALYYYFADRDELVEAVFDEELDLVVTTIERTVAEAPSAREALHGLCREFSTQLQAGSPFALALTSEATVSHSDALSVVSTRFMRVVDVLAGQLERAKGEGVVREDVDARVAAVFLLGGFLMVSLSAADFGLFADTDLLLDALYGLSVRGVGAER